MDYPGSHANTFVVIIQIRCSLQGINAYRIINSAFPPISVFEDTLDPADLDIAFALESLTNDRLRFRFHGNARIFAMCGMTKPRPSLGYCK